jgi:hypothetical protein
MTAAQRDSLARRLQTSVAQIDELLRHHGSSPDHLPGPSRRAYEFLKHLDLSKIPADSSALPAPERYGRLPGSVRFVGLRAFLDGLLDDVARRIAAGPSDLVALLRVVQQTAQRLNHGVDRGKLDAGQLKSESLEMLGWFRYFADQPHLEEYGQAVRRAQQALGGLAFSNCGWRLPLLVHFRPCRHLYRWQVLADGTRIILQTPMVALDAGAFADLGRLMLGDKGNWPAVTEAMLSEACQEARVELELAAGSAERARGLAYDLAEVFERVNRRYFAGGMERPKLTWTRMLTGTRFGHYDFIRNVVCISSTLDRPNVPDFVLDHVMHHELLHKKHGFVWTGSRRNSHTPEFRAEERGFERYEEADRYLQAVNAGKAS